MPRTVWPTRSRPKLAPRLPQHVGAALADDVRWISRIRFLLLGGHRPEFDQKAVEVDEAKTDSDAALDRATRILKGYTLAEHRRRTK